MGSTNILSDKDVNTSGANMANANNMDSKLDIKSMEYHRQVLASKIEEEKYGTTKQATIALPSSSPLLVPSPLSLPPPLSSMTTRGPSTITSHPSSPSTATSVPKTLSPARNAAIPMRFHRNHGNAVTVVLAPADPNSPAFRKKQYISPSDNIMSPCTAKLNALKSRQAGKVKPKSLFAQASAKKFDGENVLGAKSAKGQQSADGI
ncbi:hypothetical protein F5Y15DRAFT_414709 [Xylariaceae sp. FL0016]|nr:hypothetical protein F5Y15DRAFT_414709 [Xylariaceae sp. FL0016]